jgi:hypothetical protein
MKMAIDNTSDIYPSKYVSSADLKGRRVTVTIREISFELMKDRNGIEQRKPVLHFKEAKKGWIVNKTNWKTLQTISKNYHDWIGKTIELQSIPTALGDSIMASIVGANGNSGFVAASAPKAAEVVPTGIDPDDDVPDSFEPDDVPDEKLPF